jgi:hypothetical protein
MNRLSLVYQEGNKGPLLMPAVDGRLLCDIAREVEMPFAKKEGHALIAGKYSGIPRERALLPSRHFLGEAEPLYQGVEGSVYLMLCECGEPGCWPFEAKISVTADEVAWSSFRQPHRAGRWDYSKLPPFHFKRSQYEEALKGEG